MQRLFGVSAGFPLVRDRQLACDPATLSKPATAPGSCPPAPAASNENPPGVLR
jgi:hypothetical protein